MNHAVIDLSENFLRLGLLRKDGLWQEYSEPMRGRESSRLAVKVTAKLQEWGVGLKDVNAWTVGAGPGNFTGLRMAASFIAGLAAADKSLQVRNVPSVYMYSGLQEDGTPCPAAVIYDGKNSELVIFRTGDNSGCVCTYAEAEEVLKSWGNITFRTTPADRETVEKVLKDISVTLPDGGISLKTLAEARLPFNGSVSALEYIRPAVRPH